MALVVSCAGDNELAKKLHTHLASKLLPAALSLREDEITIQLGIKNDATLDKVILSCEMCGISQGTKTN